MNIKELWKNHWAVLLIQFSLLIVAFTAFLSLTSKVDVLTVAIIVDGKASDKDSRVEALKLYAERINRFGGVKGKELEIEVYFEHNTQEKAVEIAEKIIQNKRIIAVLGGSKYQITDKVMDIYDQAKIPLLLTQVNVTTESPWIFETLPSPQNYGEYMANYTYKILKKEKATILNSPTLENHRLTGAFRTAFEKLGGVISDEFSLDSVDNTALIESFEANSSDNFLLVVGDRKNACASIVALKRASIDVSIMSDDTEISEGFLIFEEEKKFKGYFSNGIITASSSHIDNLGHEITSVINDYKNTYQKYINNQAIRTASTLSMILGNLPEKLEDMPSLHQSLIDKLSKNEHFNAKRKAVGSILSMGYFEKQNLVTAKLDPLIVVYGDLTKEESKKVLKVGNISLYPTNIVYSGVSMNNISEIDMENLTYKMDFFLWFRYNENVENVEDIEFLNAVTPTRLIDILGDKTKSDVKAKADDVSAPIEAKLVSKTTINGESYTRYHIRGFFKTADANNYALGRQDLYVKFRNYKENRFKLSYVSDYFNSNMGIFSQESIQNIDTLEELKFEVLAEPSLTLNYNLTYVGRSHKVALGNPSAINTSNEFSQFIAQYSIKPVLWSVRGLESWINAQLPGGEEKIEIPSMIIFLSISMIIFIFTLYGQKEEFFGEASTYWWILQLIVTSFILVFTEFALSQTLFNLRYSDWGLSNLDTISSLMAYANHTIAILWWLVPTYYITSAFEQFLWNPIKKKTGAEVPNVLRLFVAIVVYLLGLIGIMAFVFEVTLTSLAATSGVLAIIFAIASKIDISNIIAGLGVSFAQVFKLGDWVKIGDVEGKVVEMTPRSTKILTFESSIINIPNSEVSGAVIENYTHPTRAFKQVIRLEIVPLYRFEMVEKVLLDAVASSEGILQDPAPAILFLGQGDSSQIFEVIFFIDDYAQKANLWQGTWRRVWRHLEQADIILATPQREVFLPKEIESMPISSARSVIDNCGAFEHLSIEDKKHLESTLIEKEYNDGEVILESLDTCTSLFIITEGVVAISTRQGKKEFKRLGVAGLFGERNTYVVAKRKTKVLMLEDTGFMKKEILVS
jgi:branched-chain amino acid transport system substrate-binding protein